LLLSLNLIHLTRISTFLLGNWPVISTTNNQRQINEADEHIDQFTTRKKIKSTQKPLKKKNRKRESKLSEAVKIVMIINTALKRKPENNRSPMISNGNQMATST